MAGASCGASAGLPCSTVWSSTMPSSLSTTWALWPNSTGCPMRPLAIGRACGSCRLTRLVAPSGVTPASRCRVCAAIATRRGQQFVQVVDGRTRRPRRRPAPRRADRALRSSAALVRARRSARLALASSALRVAGRGLGQFGQLAGHPQHRSVRLVATRCGARPQLRRRSRAPACRPRGTGPGPGCAPRRPRPGSARPAVAIRRTALASNPESVG